MESFEGISIVVLLVVLLVGCVFVVYGFCEMAAASMERKRFEREVFVQYCTENPEPRCFK